MAKIFCAEYPTMIRSYIQQKLKPDVFKDGKKPAGYHHYYRGMREEEVPRLLEPRYSFGPHTGDEQEAGRYHAEVIGWFITNAHQSYLPSEANVTSPIGEATPNELDNRSKAKLILKYGLDPKSCWKPYFSAEWEKVHESLRRDESLRAVLLAERRLLEIKNFFPNAEINPYEYIPLFDCVDGQQARTSAQALFEHLTGQAFVNRLYQLSDRVRMCGYLPLESILLPELISTLFLPLDIDHGRLNINLDNFMSAYSFLMRFNSSMLFGEIRGQFLPVILAAIYGAPTIDSTFPLVFGNHPPHGSSKVFKYERLTPAVSRS
ncbi:MAG: hypothetical protein WC529_03875 [Candidatus Margulisiibacteriota bacterium]